jgi:hypothetical protein
LRLRQGWRRHNKNREQTRKIRVPTPIDPTHGTMSATESHSGQYAPPLSCGQRPALQSDWRLSAVSCVLCSRQLSGTLARFAVLR